VTISLTGKLPRVNGSVDEVIERILRSYDAIAVVGASHDPSKPSHYVPAHMQQHGWRIIPVNPYRPEILGQPAYKTLSDVPEPVRFVNVFRRSEMTPPVVRDAVAAGATAVWLQLGIASEESRAMAEAAGLLYVEDRCLLVEQRRLGLDAPKLT
jgi:predicted CoA-binding protein